MAYKDKAKRREYDRVWHQKRNKYRRENGLCITCGIKCTESRCPSCAYKHNSNEAKRIRKSPELLQKSIESARLKRQLRKKDNKCIRCGAPLIDYEYDYCEWCRSKAMYL